MPKLHVIFSSTSSPRLRVPSFIVELCCLFVLRADVLFWRSLMCYGTNTAWYQTNIRDASSVRVYKIKTSNWYCNCTCAPLATCTKTNRNLTITLRSGAACHASQTRMLRCRMMIAFVAVHAVHNRSDETLTLQEGTLWDIIFWTEIACALFFVQPFTSCQLRIQYCTCSKKKNPRVTIYLYLSNF